MPTSNPRRTNSAARNKVRAQVLAEETNCAIPTNEGGCGGHPVDKTLTMQWGKHGPRCKGDGCPGCTPHDLSAEVDEIVPVSQGGSPYIRANCRLSHRICNRNRNKKRPIAVPPAEQFPISSWGGMFDTLKTARPLGETPYPHHR